MMSPEEVRTVNFDKQNMGGYRRVDVDSFLQQIADELEESQRKQAEAEKKLLVLAQKIEEYRKDEDNVKTALLNAQRMAENIIREARQKSEAMLREAGIKADDIVQNAKGRVTDEQLELERVQGEVARFKANVLQLYKQHIESLSTLPGGEENVEEVVPQEQAPQAELPREEEPQPQAVAEPELEISFDLPDAEEEKGKTESPEITFDLSGLVEPEEEEKKEEAEEPEDQAPLFDSFQGIKFSD